MTEPPVQPDILLASQSPRRKLLLEQIGVRFNLISTTIEELQRNMEQPTEFVLRMAEEKALAGLKASAGQLPVLGADTVVVFNQCVMGKPTNYADAYRMLSLLSGNTHHVLTAVAIANGSRVESLLSDTEVLFNSLSDNEIKAYWLSGEPQDKAGAYGIQGLGAVFVKQITGSYSCVVGLPLSETVELLKNFSVPWWQNAVTTQEMAEQE